MTEMTFRFDCSQCKNKCDGISKMNYRFESDVDYSERKENYVIDCINRMEGYHAEKCEKPGYPDIMVRKGDEIFYIEIKAQRRTFMSVKKILPEGDLIPSETLALNLSDLQRYFSIREQDGNKIFIMWCLENRPCIVEEGNTRYFYQDIDELKRIYEFYQERRRFRRKSGNGDWVNGQHRGVVVNYHFSIEELKEATEGNNFIEILEDERENGL